VVGCGGAGKEGGDDAGTGEWKKGMVMAVAWVEVEMEKRRWRHCGPLFPVGAVRRARRGSPCRMV
jgi:hypothetical protein